MWHDNESELDMLGFERFATAIVDLVTTNQLLPLTVGLFGDWGSGKSTVLRMVENQLKEREGAISLRFDGWLFEGYDDAKAALMTTVIERLMEQIKSNKSLLDKVGDSAQKLLKRVDWFRVVGLAAKGILTLTSPAGAAVVGGLSLASLAQGALEKLQDPKSTIDPAKELLKPEQQIEELHQSIREFRTEFQELIEKAGISPLVILIDDLDRCLPESITATLEAIKLFLAVSGTAFVIAADERIVRHAISLRYPPEQYREADLSQEYLDKLVQVPVILPALDTIEASTYIYLLFAQYRLGSTSPDEFNKLFCAVNENRRNPQLPEPLNFGIAKNILGESCSQIEEDFTIAARLAPLLADGLDGNPRLIKRFLNTLSLRLKMASSLGFELDAGILSKLMVLERFHEELFKELFRWQASQNGIPEQMWRLENAVNSKKLKEKDAKRLSPEEENWMLDEDVVRWLHLEPPFAGIDLSRYFFMARETVRISSKAGRKLSPELQELFAELQSKSDAALKAGAKKLNDKPLNEIFAVYDALWARVESSPRHRALEGIFELANLQQEIATRLIQDLSKLPHPAIEARLVPKVGTLTHTHPTIKEQISNLLVSWNESTTNKRLANAAGRVLSTISEFTEKGLP